MEYHRDTNTPGEFIAAGSTSLLRELFGILSAASPSIRLAGVQRNAVLHLAQMIDETHDFERLPILADALEEAGWTTTLLQHAGERRTPARLLA